MKVTLRELLLLVALAAMGCGWWVHGTRQAGTIHRLEGEKRQAEHKAKVARLLFEANMETLDTHVPNWRELARHY